MNSMYLAVGYSCNHHCFFCPIGDKSRKAKAASTEDLIEVVDRGIRDDHIDHITISGGEPTLHPGLHDILAHCTENGLRATILTNGDRFHDRQFTHDLFESLDHSRISVVSAIHSPYPGLHDHVTGSAGSQERTIQGLKNLIACHIPFTVKQVISRWNFRDLPEFVRFVYREFGPYSALTLCGMDFCGMNEADTREVAVSYSEIRPNLEKALDYIEENRETRGGFPLVTVADLPLCTVDPYYWKYFAMVSRGRLKRYSAPYSAAETGKDEIRSSEEVWNDCDIYFQQCRECCVKDQCPGTWRSAFEHFGETAVKAFHKF